MIMQSPQPSQGAWLFEVTDAQSQILVGPPSTAAHGATLFLDTAILSFTSTIKEAILFLSLTLSKFPSSIDSQHLSNIEHQPLAADLTLAIDSHQKGIGLLIF